MRKILIVAGREYRSTVRTKGFIIGLILAPILIGGSGIAFLLLKGKVDTTDKRVAVIDYSGVVAETLVEAAEARNEQYVYDSLNGKKVRPAFLLEVIEPDPEAPDAQRLMLSDRIRSGKLFSIIEIGPGVLAPSANPETAYISYYARNAVMDEVRQWAERPINLHLRRMRLADLGASDSLTNDILAWTVVTAFGLVSRDRETGTIAQARKSTRGEAVVVPIAVMVLAVIMIMMGAAPLLNAVMEEKSQRIAEVMLSAVKPTTLMAGKLVGGVAVSLTSSAVYILVGIAAVSYLGLDEYFPYHILPWLFAFMIAAIVMYGSINTALGATCDNAKDAQSLMLPAMLPAMVPMFVLGLVITQPTAGFATWLSLIPPFTPILMLLRMSTPADIPAWQPWAGLVGVLIFTVFMVWAGGRVFRVGILMQGTPPRLSNIIRWALRG